MVLANLNFTTIWRCCQTGEAVSLWAVCILW
nr:MAG TPA: hypothetical protein [Caudoviricetes sp.]